MANYLIAAYNLRLKSYYSTVKEKLPGKLQPGKPQVNKKRATAYMLKWVRKSFQEGVEYAKVDAKARTGKTIDRAFNIGKRLKERLLKEFLLKVSAAGAVYNLEIENYNKLKKFHLGATQRKDPQRDQIFFKYQNAVTAAAGNLILNAGGAGTMAVYEELQ